MASQVEDVSHSTSRETIPKTLLSSSAENNSDKMTSHQETLSKVRQLEDRLSHVERETNAMKTLSQAKDIAEGSKTQRIEVELEQVKQQLSQITKKAEKMKDNLHAEGAKIQQLESDHEEFERQHAQIEKVNSGLKSTINVLVTFIILLVAVNAAFVFFLIQKNQNMEKLLFELQKDISKPHKETWQLEADVKMAKQHHEQIKEKNEKMETVLNELQSNVSEHNKMLKEVMKKVEDSEGPNALVLKFDDNECAASDDSGNCSQRPMPGSAMSRQHAKMKEIQDQSKFEVQMVNPLPMIPNKLMYFDNFDTVNTASDFMDAKTGIYTAPVKGEYSFKLSMKQEGTDPVTWYLCSSANGRKEKVQDLNEESTGQDWFNSDINWICNGKEKVWVEAITEDTDTKVEVKLSGQLMKML